MKRIGIMVAAALLLSGFVCAQDGGSSKILEARTLYQNQEYRQAVTVARDMLLDPQATRYHGDALFIMGKALLAEGRLSEASRSFETLVASWPEHPGAEESRYQQGRILYLQGDYGNSVQALTLFLEKYPSSSLVSNARYWTGEALYASGWLEESRGMFESLLTETPGSPRAEAARYKISLIDLKKREQGLLDLLRWTHQENIRNMEDARTRLRSMEDALRSLQKRLFSLAPQDMKDELLALQTKITRLTEERDTISKSVESQNARIRSLQDQVMDLQARIDKARETELALRRDLARPTDDAMAELERRKILLDAREKALQAKEDALRKAGE